MAIQTTGVRYVSEGIDQFISNVQKAQANLDAMSKNMAASSKAVRGAASDLNTHSQSLNAYVRSANAIGRAQSLVASSSAGIHQSISSGATAMGTFARMSDIASLAFRTFTAAGRGLGSIFSGIVSVGKGVGSALGSMSKGFIGLVSGAKNSIATLTGFRGISSLFSSDILHLVHRVLALSAAFAALAATKSFITMGLEQVAMYDRLTHSIAALTANELLAAGSVNTFKEGLQQALPFTKETLDWIERLAIISIFESGDIQAVQQFGQSVGMSAKDASAMTFALTAWGTVTDKQPHTLMLIANALTDMFSKGKVQAEEMKQLARNGIPAWEMLSKALGVTVAELREMVSDGLVPADVGIKALVSGMANQYGPALGDFAFSISGITSSLKDIAKINSRELFRGIVEAAMPFMERVVSVLTQPEVKASFQEMGKSLGEIATQAFTFVEALIASGDPIAFLALKIDETIPGFFKLHEQLGKLGATFMEIAKNAFGWGEGIGKSVAEGIVAATSLVVDAVQKIADVINKFLGGKGISPTAGIQKRINENTDSGTPTMPEPEGPGAGAPPELPGGMGSPLGFDSSMFDPLTESLGRLNSAADAAKAHWDDLRKAFTDARQSAEENIPGFEKLEPLVAGLGSAFGVILASGAASAGLALLRLLSPIGLLTAAGAGLYSAWQNNFLGIRDIVNDVIPVVQQKFGELQAYLSGPFIRDVEDFIKRFQAGWADAQSKTQSASDAINKAVETQVMPVIEELATFFEKELKPTIDKVATAAIPVLVSAFNLVASIVANLVIPQIRLAWEVFSTLLWPVIETGADILSNVLFPALSLVFDFIANNILPVYRDWYTFLSGSVIPIIERLTTIIVLLIEIGVKQAIIEWNNMTAAITDVWNWFNNLIDKVPGLRQSIDGFVGSIGVVISWLGDWSGAFQGVIDAIQGVISWLDGIISKLKEISNLQSVVLGNSPSPMEMSLRGIGATLNDLIKGFEKFTRTLINTGSAGEDLAEDLQSIAENTRDFIDDIEEVRLGGLIGGLDLSRENLRFSEDFKNDIMEDSDELSAFWQDHLRRVATGVGNELEMARQKYLQMAEIDPEAATDRFELESTHIKERGEIEAEIAKAKTDAERQRLMKERTFLYERQALEIKLFEQQAQRRAEAVEREAKALVDAFAQAWQQMMTDQVIPTPDLTQLFQLIQALSQLDLPPWLTPGSPTPLENAIRGISGAMHQLALTELPTLKFQLQHVGTPASLGQIMSMNNSQSYTYAPQYNLGVTTNQSPQYAFQSFEMMRSLYGS